MLNFRMEEIPSTITLYNLANTSVTLRFKFQLLPKI
jgi:hypothetical protein